MPSQQVEIAETIAALKRALKRNGKPASSDPISQVSNRGNKLKAGAQFVHQGSLAYIKGPEVYKEKVEHAGYTRYILDRNPIRYDEYGDEIDDVESDDEAEAIADDDNAYAGLKLEELLCPLRHPSELPIHPTLSQPYLSTTLPDMIDSTNAQLRKEKANLWRAKDLHRQLIGDEPWVPCETVETTEDWDLFAPKWRPTTVDSSQGKKRKRDEAALDGPGQVGSGSNNIDSDARSANLGNTKENTSGESDKVTEMVDSEEGQDATQSKQTKNTKKEAGEQIVVAKIEPQDEVSGDTILGNTSKRTKNGATSGNVSRNESNGDIEIPDVAEDDKGVEVVDGEAQPGAGSEEELGSASASPDPPPRRITRALAQTANNSSTTGHDKGETNGSTSIPASPTSSSTSLQVDPLFLVRSLRPHPQISPFHLPPAEHSETISLLTSYIQKQSAFIATLTSVLARLLQAERLRKTVFHWCKAEGHVNEMSDGEDWIDEEAWGLEQGELKKGKGDEEDVEVQEGYMGRGKGKRRRGGAGNG